MEHQRKEFPLYNREGIIIEVDPKIKLEDNSRNYLLLLDGRKENKEGRRYRTKRVYFLPPGSLKELAECKKTTELVRKLNELNPSIWEGLRELKEIRKEEISIPSLISIFQKSYEQEKLRKIQRETL